MGVLLKTILFILVALASLYANDGLKEQAKQLGRSGIFGPNDIQTAQQCLISMGWKPVNVIKIMPTVLKVADTIYKVDRKNDSHPQIICRACRVFYKMFVDSNLKNFRFHVYNLYVYPAFRHRGKAKELLNMAINKIRAFGYDGEIQIVANPKEDGIDANKLRLFYQRMGFKVFSYYDE